MQTLPLGLGWLIRMTLYLPKQTSAIQPSKRVEQKAQKSGQKKKSRAPSTTAVKVRKGISGDFRTWPQLLLSSSSFANNGTASESLKVGYAKE